jgi:transcriptional regulator with XRE-family HTH domain
VTAVKQGQRTIVTDVASVIRQRLNEFGIGQRELAIAAGVTESYISQLLANKKAPPAADRTDIYGRIAKILKLSSRELSELAGNQRREQLKRKIVVPPQPLFQGFRQLVIRKCVPAKKKQIATIFEREAFGELERFVTQRLLDVAKRVARKELDDENWIHRVAQVSKQTCEEARVLILEFLDTDVFHVSAENCISFLDPLIQRWDIEFDSFSMEVVLNRRLTSAYLKRLEVREAEQEKPDVVEPGFLEFLEDEILSSGISDDEIAFLKSLVFNGRRPLPLYYYRELQNLRDPLNFALRPDKRRGIRRGQTKSTARRGQGGP